jgi:hypothetical protein
MQLRNLKELATLYQHHKENKQPLPQSIEIQGDHPNVACQFKHKPLAEAETKALFDVLTSGLCPPDFALDLGQIKLEKLGAEALGNALATGSCPIGFTLILEGNIVTEKMRDPKLKLKKKQRLFSEKTQELIQPIANALEQKNVCPEDFHLVLNLNSFAISPAVEILSKPLTVGNAPDGFSLTLGHEISLQAMRSIANALKSGHCPNNFCLKFKAINSDKMMNALADELAQALSTGYCPLGLSLSFQFTRGGHTNSYLLSVFAQALASGKCPTGLNINFPTNRYWRQIEITEDTSFKQLVKTLTTKQCPSDLSIDLGNRVYSTESILLLAQALSEGNYPEDFHLQGLFVDLRINSIIENLKNSILVYKCQPGLDIKIYCDFHYLILGENTQENVQKQINQALQITHNFHRNLKETALLCTTLLQGCHANINLPLVVFKLCSTFLAPHLDANIKQGYDRYSRIFVNNVVGKYKKWGNSANMFPSPKAASLSQSPHPVTPMETEQSSSSSSNSGPPFKMQRSAIVQSLC